MMSALPLQGDVTAIANSINAVWVLVVTFLIFFMQPGFALLEAGQVRAKNAGNVVMKNMWDWSAGVLVFFLLGAGVYAMAGQLTSPGIAFDVGGAFGYISDPGGWYGWLFGAVFAMTAATIVSGAVAERIKFSAYVIYALVITAVIYPVVGGMTWGGTGLLSSAGYLGQALGVGYKDFAGATVVHALGGIAAGRTLGSTIRPPASRRPPNTPMGSTTIGATPSTRASPSARTPSVYDFPVPRFPKMTAACGPSASIPTAAPILPSRARNDPSRTVGGVRTPPVVGSRVGAESASSRPITCIPIEAAVSHKRGRK